MPVKSYDPVRHAIEFAAPWTGNHRPVRGCRYYLEQSPRFLDSPGEYWYDVKTGRLHVRLPGDHDPNSHVIEAPREVTLIDIPDQGHIEASGVTFRFQRRVDLHHRFWDVLDEDPACVKVRGAADDVRIANDRFEDVAPYGYRRREDGELEPDPEQVGLMRRVFRDYVEGGSFKGIARQLNSEGVPTERGGEWHASTVSDILENEVYIGRLVFNQRTFYRDRKTGRRRYRWNPEDDWIILERPKPAIVSKDLFDKAEQRRAKRRRKGPETHRTYALSGIVQCAECGNAYIAQVSANTKGRYVYMTCGNRASGGTCTNRFRFREDIVREELAARLDEVLLSEKATEALKKTIKRLVLAQLAGRDAHLKAIEEKRRDCQRSMAAVKKLMVDAVTRGDGTDEIALVEREKELRIGPRLDFSELNRIVDEAVAEQREGLLEVEDAEKVRNALRVLVGRLEAHPDGRLVYKTSPVSLLETDGASRVGMVAGARYVPEKKTWLCRLAVGSAFQDLTQQRSLPA